MNADFNGQSRYLQALIDVCVLQASQVNAQSPAAPDDLHTYARRKLREQMLADHPADGGFEADDLILTVNTYANDGHGLCFPQLIDSRTLTLTEYAIGRLEATGASPVAAVADRPMHRSPPGLTPNTCAVGSHGGHRRHLSALSRWMARDEQYKPGILTPLWRNGAWA
nr:hypothetical protein [Prescottella equi]